MSLLRLTMVIHGPEDTEAIDRDIVQALNVGFRGTEFELEQLENVYQLEQNFEVTFSQVYKMSANSQAEAVDEARASLVAQVRNEGHSMLRHIDVQVEGGDYMDMIVRGYDPDGQPVYETVDV